MPVSRKNDETGASPKAQMPASGTRRVLSMKDSSGLPSKRTLNLCMREQSGISVEMFLFILSLILIVIILVEFVGIYRPYLEVERLERDLAAAQTALDDKNRAIREMDDYYQKTYGMTMQEYYNQYNFEGYDRSIADRADVFALLEHEIIDKPGYEAARIGVININGNTVTLTIYGLEFNSTLVKDLTENLSNDKMVYIAYANNMTRPEDGETSIRMTIELRDATTVKEDTAA